MTTLNSDAAREQRGGQGYIRVPRELLPYLLIGGLSAGGGVIGGLTAASPKAVGGELTQIHQDLLEIRTKVFDTAERVARIEGRINGEYKAK